MGLDLIHAGVDLETVTVGYLELQTDISARTLTPFEGDRNVALPQKVACSSKISTLATSIAKC